MSTRPQQHEESGYLTKFTHIASPGLATLVGRKRIPTNEKVPTEIRAALENDCPIRNGTKYHGMQVFIRMSACDESVGWLKNGTTATIHKLQRSDRPVMIVTACSHSTIISLYYARREHCCSMAKQRSDPHWTNHWPTPTPT